MDVELLVLNREEGLDHVARHITDRDRLTVAETVRRRMATCAGVVVVQAGDRVAPEQTPDVREAPVWRRRMACWMMLQKSPT